MKPSAAPVTKYLPRYSAWFIARLVAGQQAAADVAWNRLLAA